MANAVCELSWLKSLLPNLKQTHSHPSLLFCDNTTSFHIAANFVFYERTKHIELDCRLIRNKIQVKELTTLHALSSHQPANMFTKPLGSTQFHSLLSKMNAHKSTIRLEGNYHGLYIVFYILALSVK